MISALSMYGDGLRGGARSTVRRHARLIDGTAIPLPLERYLGPADATDERLLDGLCGPVLVVHPVSSLMGWRAKIKTGEDAGPKV